MKTFIIVVASLIAGAFIGGFLGLGGGTVGGVLGGMIVGTQTGVCVATEVATQAGLMPGDKADELVAKAVERIRSSRKAQSLAGSPKIRWVANIKDCDTLLGELNKAAN